jgi:tetratricopeptide (TPR) repeat protein
MGGWQAKYDEAVEQYSEAIKQNPSMASAFNNRAMSYLKLGQFHLTEADCNAALKLEPSNAKVCTVHAGASLGGAVSLAKRPVFVVASADHQILTSVLRMCVEEQALLRRGTARAMQAMFTEAMADFEAVLVQEPTNKAAKQEIVRLRKMAQAE